MPGDRQHSQFGGRHRDALSAFATGQDVIDELARLGAGSWVITSNLPSRGLEGIPYADAPRGVDPGIAVWFAYKRVERVLACDRWYRPEENLRAIAKSIEAMRGLERWGVADVLESVFTGFAAALPPGAPPAAKRPWRDVLEMGNHQMLDASDQLAVAKARHRKLIAEAHPDAGGDHVRAAELNAALTEAEAELTR
jgi:hypothetical protein